MCIRDRTQPAASCVDQFRRRTGGCDRTGRRDLRKYESCQREQDSTGSERTGGKERDRKPVSYTHLDVYKRQVMGIGEAAGMFPIDSSVHTWDARMLEQFDALTAEKGFSWKLKEILPEVLVAGEDALSLIHIWTNRIESGNAA